MLEYKREHARSAESATLLSSQLHTLQSQHAALSAAWESLNHGLANLYPHSTGPPVPLPDWDAFPALGDFARALEEASQSTMGLIASIVNQHSQGPSLSDLSSKCAQLTRDALATKRALDVTQKNLQRAQSDLQSKHEALVKAEKQLDRAASKTVGKLNNKGKEPELPPTPQSSKPASPRAPSPQVCFGWPCTLNLMSRQNERAPPSHQMPEPKADHAMLVDSTELDELRHLATSRMAQIEGMSSERTGLIQEIDALRFKVCS
jgi:hypothetical protein